MEGLIAHANNLVSECADADEKKKAENGGWNEEGPTDTEGPGGAEEAKDAPEEASVWNSLHQIPTFQCWRSLLAGEGSASTGMLETDGGKPQARRGRSGRRPERRAGGGGPAAPRPGPS